MHTTSPEQSSTQKPTFATLQISEKMLLVLKNNGFITPTPIQERVIPTGIEGKDIIGIAQTGTGKTLGFGIPMIEQLLKQPGRGLVVLPTRELALQVEETFRKIGGPVGISSVVLIGGDSMYRQIGNLRRNPRIIIATPGRLIDHLKQKTVVLDTVSILVLDEADHMFDIGFAPQIKEIIKRIPNEHQTLLFSATMPKQIADLAVAHMKLPLRIEVAPAGTTAEKVEQEIIVVEKKSKFSLMVKILSEHTDQTILVFTRTKFTAKTIARNLRNIGISATEIHSNRSLNQRKEALSGFKNGKYRILAATDIAARGIDVKDIGLVINYDLPEQIEDYVHRIGRTGRAGKSGKAISFATPDQRRDILDIERLIKKPIPKKSHNGAEISASFTPAGRKHFGSFHKKGFSGNRRSFRGRGRPSNSRRRFGGQGRQNGERP